MSEASVWIDDVELQSLGIDVRLSSDEPMLPNVRQQSITVPGRHGAYDFGAFFDVRKFELDCVFPRQTHTDIKRQIREFARMFVDDYGRPKTVKLRFGDEIDKYYSVKLGGNVPIERLSGRGVFRLPLVAHDPLAKFMVPSDQIDLDSDIPLLSDITLDAQYSFDFAMTTEATRVVTVYNEGTLTVRPTLVFTGSADYLAVSVTGGGSFVIAPFVNKTIEINGENYTVKQDGVSSLSLMTAGKFIELAPGINQLTVRGINLSANLKVKFNYQYM
jgi:phage-related protein